MTTISLAQGELSIDVHDVDGTLRVHWSGGVDEEDANHEADPREMEEFLDQHVPADVPVVVLDFTAVDSLGPEAAGPIVKTLRKLNTSGATVTILFDPEHAFQKFAFADLVSDLKHFPNVSVAHAQYSGKTEL